jgi:hypothetical protein
LTETASLWPTVRVAYRWVHRAAHILTNEEQHPGAAVKRRLGGVLGAMTPQQAAAGRLAPALAHCLKVSRSYWPGLFHCYDVPDLPRTKNDLEQFFGTHRYHERRATPLATYRRIDRIPSEVKAFGDKVGGDGALGRRRAAVDALQQRQLLLELR